MFQDYEEALLNLHTAFVGKVTKMNGETKADIQPLTLMKQLGRPPKKQALLKDVPVLEHVRHIETFKAGEDMHEGHVQFKPLKAGDIVLCVCCERDITEAKKGNSVLPPIGHHLIKDAVVVGCFNGVWK